MERLLSEMPLQSPYHQLSSPLTCPSITITLLNANSAKLHFEDITSDPVLQCTDILALTETYITDNHKRNYEFQDYRLFMKNPNLSQNHHGIALYISETVKANLLELPVNVGIEVLCAGVQFLQGYQTAVLLYRSPSVPQRNFFFFFFFFFANLESVLTWLQENKTQNLILLGDFNIDILNKSSSPLQRLMKRFGFKQVVSEPTHRSGSCLDHIYLAKDFFEQISIITTYYSGHFFVLVQLLN